MMIETDRTWMWHPHFTECRDDTAGLFVHFRRNLTIDGTPPSSLCIQITADTRYKLYVNYQLVFFGPVKGDQDLWFYDHVDIGPFLTSGHNVIGVHVLRLFYSTSNAPSFARSPFGGLRISPVRVDDHWAEQLASSILWETAIDESSVLRIDQPEDHFLHIYERRPAIYRSLVWVAAKLLGWKVSTGNTTPWNLSKRMIPPPQSKFEQISAIHNLRSTIDLKNWERKLCTALENQESQPGLVMPAGTKHRLDLEVPFHTTAFIAIKFKRPLTSGSLLSLTYSESYEDEPESTPWVRRKGNRCDTSKDLFGPEDIYHFNGPQEATDACYYPDADSVEVFMPFHFRTFRFIRLSITVKSSDLVLQSFAILTTRYPLETHANFKADDNSEKLWMTSIQTLNNCMHDCYEDCPFYEQLQYAMDTRSSALFTYCLSGDDRLAQQAITQLHNSFNARVGLTASRAPSHRKQFIPHFSLYWICMICDHFTHFRNRKFVSQFLSVIDAVLWYFHSRIDSQYGLTKSEIRPGIWNFVDWTTAWKPHGVPSAIQRTGFSTYTNQLYAYTLVNAANLSSELDRPIVATGNLERAAMIISALREHCFDGEYFTDTVTCESDPTTDYSQHCQIWGVLSGTVTGHSARKLLRRSLQQADSSGFVQESISMSFYTMRALSLAGGNMYDEHFHRFWKPWKQQLANNVTTWVEDDVSQRSDCHAWGSVPIYEFIVEIAGIRPAKPGWAALEFRPRIATYPQIEATIPFKMVDGKPRGFAHVSWSTLENGDTKVQLRLQLKGSDRIPVNILLLGRETFLIMGSESVEFVLHKNNV